MKKKKRSISMFGIIIILLTVFFIIPSELYAGMKEILQTINVRGTVTDELGEPIVGVTVRVKGENVGSATDAEGNYSINVSKDATLIFSFVGYKTQEVKINGRSIINVVLKEDVQILQETVVIGYGTVKKRDLTGAVSSLRGEDLLKTNPVSLNQGLQGKLAGTSVSQADGAPLHGISIKILGANSFTTSTEPL